MKTTFKHFAIRTLAITAFAAGAMSSANAAIIFYRAPVVVAPVVYAAPVIVAPVAVYVPTCRWVAMPFLNAYTGWTYMVTRRVCN